MFTGYEKSTEFYFKTYYSPLSAIKTVKWVFGDGFTSNELNPTHRFLHEGIYDVTNYVFTQTQTITSTSAVNIKPYIEESIWFEFVPPPAFEGHYNRYPFKINITSKTTEPHMIDLSAMFSRSYKHQESPNKWQFLRPEWRFLDLDGNIIDRIETIDTVIKIDDDGNLDPNGTIVGVSGYAQFYFVDDLYNIDLFLKKEPFTTIIATLETSKTPAKIDYIKTKSNVYGYANSKASVIFPYVVMNRPPEALRITENGVSDHTNPKWTDAKTPFVITSNVTGKFLDYFTEGNGASKLYQPLDFFLKSSPINSRTIPVSTTVSNLVATFIPEPIEFKLYDDTNYKVSGYYKGYFETNTVSALNCHIAASANLTVSDLSGNYVYPLLWISNPANGTIGTTQYFLQSNLSAASTINLHKAHNFSFDVPVIDETNFQNNGMDISGFHGINSIAVIPFPSYHAWTADSEKNYIYRFSTNGEMQSKINLIDIFTERNIPIPVNNQVSPATLTLDGEYNLWVTLYDTASTLKFDKYGELITIFTPNQKNESPNINSTWLDNIKYYPSNANENGDNNFLEPTGIDSDKDNNIWITYSHFASGYLVKYDNTATNLLTVSLPLCSCPQEVVCDRDGYVWLVNSNTIWNSMGIIEKRNTNGTLLSSFTGFKSPNYATIDYDQNLWFTFDYNKIGKINTRTSVVSMATVTPLDTDGDPDYWFKNTPNIDDTILEGISTDIRGNVYVINGLENQIYIYDQNTMAYKDRYMINPQGKNFYVETPFGPTVVEYNLLGKSLQAQGDWSGFRWVNKFGKNYLPEYKTRNSLYVTGNTESLNYYKENPYIIRKINEDFDMVEYMKSLTHMPNIQKNTDYFYDVFLKSIFGGNYNDPDSKTYEKIANFLLNHGDVDTANVEQLYNLTEMVDLDTDDYRLVYPENIKKILDLVSINESLLWGDHTIDELDVVKLHKNSQPVTTTFMVTAGFSMVLKTNSLNSYRIIPVGLNEEDSVYSIQRLATSLNLDPNYWSLTYSFYPLNESLKDTKYTNNIIDWENKTNISPQLSAVYSDWAKDGGIVETMLSYELYSGLDFLD